MSRESLGTTGFETTNVEELLKEVNAAALSSSDQSTLKATTIGQESLLEKKLGLDLESKPKENLKKIKPSSTETLKEGNVEENEFTKLFNTVKNYKESEIISGVVSKIINGLVYVDIAYKAEGIIEPEEISNNEAIKAIDVCKPGDKIWVKILRLENKAGNPVLSKKRADYDLAWNKLNHAAKTNEDIEVQVTGERDGGLLVDFGGVSAYIPNTQLTQEDNGTKVGSTIAVKVLKVHRARRKVILTHRSSKDKNSQAMQEALKGIKVGDVLKGKVSSIKSFGAFVNLGGIDGLVHISEISWKRVEKVEDVLALEQEVEVYVLGIDEATNRVSLSMKKLEKDPWAEVETKLHAGDSVQCTVTRLAQFGAFAMISEGVEGLIHITELSDTMQVKHPQEAVEVGKEYTAKILRLDPKAKRIALSLRSDATVPAEPDQSAPVNV